MAEPGTRAQVSVLGAWALDLWGTVTSFPSKYVFTGEQIRPGTETQVGKGGGWLKVTQLANSITWVSLIWCQAYWELDLAYALP